MLPYVFKVKICLIHMLINKKKKVPDDLYLIDRIMYKFKEIYLFLTI